MYLLKYPYILISNRHFEALICSLSIASAVKPRHPILPPLLISPSLPISFFLKPHSLLITASTTPLDSLFINPTQNHRHRFHHSPHHHSSPSASTALSSRSRNRRSWNRRASHRQPPRSRRPPPLHLHCRRIQASDFRFIAFQCRRKLWQ